MGTPAYMPPEQARSQADRIEQRSDVFGLGAILCEVLTGKPPYTAEASWQLYQKAVQADLDDAYARLDGSGADAELVSLARRCLAVEPGDRPRDARAVAAEVTAYLEGVEAKLRQAEVKRAEAEVKVREERKRRRVTLALVASVLLLVVVGSGGWLWIERERNARLEEAGRVELARLERKGETERQVYAALTDAARLREQARAARIDVGRWEAVEAAVRRAKAAIDTGEADGSLREEVLDQLAVATLQRQGAETLAANAEKDRRMVEHLDEIRLLTTEAKDGFFSPLLADRAYAEAFREFGADVETDPDRAVAMLSAREARVLLAAAIDDWALARRAALEPGADSEKRWRLLFDVARRVDPDPKRGEIREAVVRQDLPALRKLAASPEAVKFAPATVVFLGRALGFRGDPKATAEYLQRAQRQHPDDFWVNEELAYFLMDQQPFRHAEAIRYYTAAIALRPQAVSARLNLAHALHNYRQTKVFAKYGASLMGAGFTGATPAKPPQDEIELIDEGIAIYRLLLERKDLSPVVRATALHHLGLAYLVKDDTASAEQALVSALELVPEASQARAMLGFLDANAGKKQQAEEKFQRALKDNPATLLAHLGIGDLRMVAGDLAGAARAYREVVRLDPDFADAWGRLGLMLLQTGKKTEAEEALRRAIALDEKHVPSLVNLALLLREKKQQEEALPLLRRAAKLAPESPVVLINLGRFLFEKKAFDEAIPPLREAVRFAPDVADPHLFLGAVLVVKGQFKEGLDQLKQARKLAKGLSAEIAEDAIREAEAQKRLNDKLEAVLSGQADPANPEEGVTLAQVCQDQRHFYHTAARLFTDALTARPALADDLAAWHRYNAACSAVLAAAGQGGDAIALSGKERVRLRQQALDWLRADLMAWGKRAESGKPADRVEVRAKMIHWKKDADFVSVRDAAIEKLPKDEQEAWRKLWADVDALLMKVEGK